MSSVNFNKTATVFLDRPPVQEKDPPFRHFTHVDDAIRFVKEEADPSLIVEIYTAEGGCLTTAQIDARYDQLTKRAS